MSPFGLQHLPAGYNWVFRTLGNGTLVAYGKDPANGWTVYVGPDNVFYSFPHAEPITPGDLQRLWNPHNVGSALNRDPGITVDFAR
jgi:hypothetical protein